jgi:ABC-type antimicrobial peptide transport system permease subunit
VLGIPIGIAAGQAIWRAFAVSLGVVPAPVVHAWSLAGVAAGVLVTANVLAAIPALGAARSRPRRVLRAE